MRLAGAGVDKRLWRTEQAVKKAEEVGQAEEATVEHTQLTESKEMKPGVFLLEQNHFKKTIAQKKKYLNTRFR